MEYVIEYRNQTIFCRTAEGLHREMEYMFDHGNVPMVVSTEEEWRQRQGGKE